MWATFWEGLVKKFNTFKEQKDSAEQHIHNTANVFNCKTSQATQTMINNKVR